MRRHAEGRLSTDFPRSPRKVLYQVPCHLKVQDIGFKSRDLLQLIPGSRGRDRREVHGPRRHLEHEDGVLPDVDEGRRPGLRRDRGASGPTWSRPTARWPASRSGRAPGQVAKHPIQIVAEAYGLAGPVSQDGTFNETLDRRRTSRTSTSTSSSGRSSARRVIELKGRRRVAAGPTHDARVREPRHRPLPDPGDDSGPSASCSPRRCSTRSTSTTSCCRGPGEVAATLVHRDHRRGPDPGDPRRLHRPGRARAPRAEGRRSPVPRALRPRRRAARIGSRRSTTSGSRSAKKAGRRWPRGPRPRSRSRTAVYRARQVLARETVEELIADLG